MEYQRHRITRVTACAAAIAALMLAGCGGEKQPQQVEYDTNLLTNGSFEELDNEGIPVGWELTPFRGLPGDEEVRYGIDDNAIAGTNSWRFDADPYSRRFYALTQEVEIGEASHIRLRGWMQIEDAVRMADQFAQCNFLLTFYDEDHRRFQELRFADKRTRLAHGTRTWWEEDSVYRLPEGTRYVMLACVLGMKGTVWFDDVSLEIPEPRPWETSTSTNYVFHWLPGHPFPEGAREEQQKLFDYFSSRLGVKSDAVIDYYLYPDTVTIREALSLKGHQYVSWDDAEIHTINPNDNHELIHFITDPYGIPPRSFAEGTVFWLHDNWIGYPVDKVAAFHLAAGQLPTIEDLVSYNRFAMLDAGISFPSAASFIHFIVERWGVADLLELYKRVNGINNYAGFSAAFELIYETPLEEVEAAWRIYLAGVDISDMPDPTAAAEAGDE